SFESRTRNTVALVFKARPESAEAAEDRVAPRSQRLDRLTEQIIGAAIEVHRELGPGLMESAYEECLCHELHLRRLKFERQMPLPVRYKGVSLDCGYRIDLVVEDAIILELKCIEHILPVHEAQL